MSFRLSSLLPGDALTVALFENLKIEMKSQGQPGACGFIDGAMVDAGMSLYQVTWAERGLSFRKVQVPSPHGSFIAEGRGLG